MEDSKNSVASRWQKQPLLKRTFTSVLQMKSSSTCLIPSSHCEGPIFYFYLKQAFELLCLIHPYVDLFNHVYYLPLFCTMLLSERIYLWKLSMTIKSLFRWACDLCLVGSDIKKASFKNKYSLFIVLWPRTKVSHHQSWFTLCIFIVIPFAYCKSSYMKGSCYLLWLVPW
jgi:hypothetical protein